MNSSTRSQIIALKERLHQLSEEARETERRKAAQAHWEKTEAEERAQEAASMLYHQNQARYLAQKEKTRVEAKAKEEGTHLRLHNKTVKQVLSQVAKASRHSKDVDDDGEDEDSDEEKSSEESEPESKNQHQHRQESAEGPVNVPKTGIEKQKGKETEKHVNKGKYQVETCPTFFFSLSQVGSFKRLGYIESRDNLDAATCAQNEQAPSLVLTHQQKFEASSCQERSRKVRERT